MSRRKWKPRYTADLAYLEREWAAFAQEKVIHAAALAHFEEMFGDDERELIIQDEKHDPIDDYLEPVVCALAAALRMMEQAERKSTEQTTA